VLDIMLSGGQATMELTELQITELDLASNASSMLISLPAHAGRTLVKIQASKLALILRVPPEVGAHIRTRDTGVRPEIDLTRFPMTEQEGEYRSADYDTTANRVDIQMDFAGGSVKIT
jgi:hypothetical protein